MLDSDGEPMEEEEVVDLPAAVGSNVASAVGPPPVAAAAADTPADVQAEIAQLREVLAAQGDVEEEELRQMEADLGIDLP